MSHMSDLVAGHKRIVRWVRHALIFALFGTLAFFAGRATIRPVEVPSDQLPSQMSVAARHVALSRPLSLTVTAHRSAALAASNRLHGVVVRVSAQSTFNEGEELYRVDDISVRVLQGQIPYYRELGPSVSGDDVAQLKAALTRLGFSPGKGNAFDGTTTTAVKAWQSRTGMPVTGVLPLGSLVAIPQTPLSIQLDRTILQPGAILAGGEKVATRGDGIPEFRLSLGKDQAALVPAKARVSIDGPQNNHWAAIVDSRTSKPEEGLVIIALAPEGKDPICARQCDLIQGAPGAEIPLSATVQVIAPIEGIAVPVSAITTEADGQTSVTVEGSEHSTQKRRVTVKGTLDGLSVVDGVREGELVRALGQPNEAPPSRPVPAQSATPGR